MLPASAAPSSAVPSVPMHHAAPASALLLLAPRAHVLLLLEAWLKAVKKGINECAINPQCKAYGKIAHEHPPIQTLYPVHKGKCASSLKNDNDVHRLRIIGSVPTRMTPDGTTPAQLASGSRSSFRNRKKISMDIRYLYERLTSDSSSCGFR